MTDHLDRVCIWSPGIPPRADLHGLPVVPCVQRGARRAVDRVDHPLVWAWTTAGDPAALAAYGPRLVADVELAAWRGGADELPAARALAAVCPAITSHGYPKRALLPALAEFASRGRVVMPQVYDGDGSTGRTRGGTEVFLRRCVSMHRDLGFERVVPILGTAAGLKILRAWQGACADLGLTFHLWAYGQIRKVPEVDRWVRDLGAAEADRLAQAPSPPDGPPAA